LETYVNTGQVQYVFRNFPLYSTHPQAQKAAEAAECAGEQGKYWEMHDLLFGRQEEWSGNPDAAATFKELAGELDLDQGEFDSCLDGGKYADKVATDAEEGMAAGVSSTPSFLINDMMLAGAYPFEAFQQRIEYFLAGGGPIELEVGADSFRSMGQPDAPVVVTEFSDFQ
jgi:protein-disulfide isomerase